MNHLLEVNQLSFENCVRLVERAIYFKTHSSYPSLTGVTMANLFYEPSTRTRVSFEMAAQNLGIRVVNMNFAQSSETKGEEIDDTIQTLRAMGITLFVMRHPQNQLPQKIAQSQPNIHMVNAGDGTHEHPSQALLDLMTIMERHPNLKDLKIAIVGDIAHSRVANSLQKIFAIMQVRDLRLIAPQLWHARTRSDFGFYTSSLHAGLQDADVIITLRVQKERLQNDEIMDLTTYHQDFALTRERIAWAKPYAMILHPGPINRGIEIDSDVADGLQSCILKQVENGVFMRMAILEALVLSEF